MFIEHSALLIILAVWNLITFIMMGMDKYLAVRRKRRISEKSLFLCAFILGGAGIICGMFVFRHKTKHWSFKILVPVAVMVNIVIYYFIFV